MRVFRLVRASGRVRKSARRSPAPEALPVSRLFFLAELLDALTNGVELLLQPFGLLA
jgi:hypothetical protein